ncbi:MAG: hypothetical protein USCGTAYLOR_02921 [Chromatiales bacterium USCg_Taylor]|nr:MAG: hypothetical protein USCGTAYLOR_02921 [Chromatiales bacterium USCg_Taylor]
MDNTLGHTVESVSLGPDHRTPQFMQPAPCCAVTSQPENSLQSQRAGTLLLTRDKPHREKPRPKWFMRVMKQCARRDGRLPSTLRTLQQTTVFHPRLRYLPAARALEALGPAKPANVVGARILTAKPSLELFKRSRVTDPYTRCTVVCHDDTLHLGAGGVKCIPSLFYSNLMSAERVVLSSRVRRLCSSTTIIDAEIAP